MSLYNTSFSWIANEAMYGHQLAELGFRSLEWKGLVKKYRNKDHNIFEVKFSN